MATNSLNAAVAPLKLEESTQPPGEPGKPYILPSLCGEIIYIPCSKSAMRLLVTGKETDNAFAVVGTGGSPSMPIGFHFHREAHDVFLCLKGSVNVWAGDQCRTLAAGDFASVPPNTIHQYQIVGEYTEFVGLIVPGGWEEFFRFIGEPYDGPMWPVNDERNPFQVLIPKLKAAAETFDMVPQPQHKGADPQAWENGKDSTLPSKLEPYYLKAMTGPRYLTGGIVVRPLATMKETNGRFAIGSIEGCSAHNGTIPWKGLKFANVHHCFHVGAGTFEITIDGSKSRITTGETVYIPKGTTFDVRFASRFAKTYVFSNAGGLLEFLIDAGKSFDENVVPEKAENVDKASLRGLVGKAQIEMV